MNENRLFITLEGIGGPDRSISILGEAGSPLSDYWDVAFHYGAGPNIKRFAYQDGGTISFETTGHSYFLKLTIEGHELGHKSPSQFAVGDKLVGQPTNGRNVPLGTIKDITPLPEHQN